MAGEAESSRRDWRETFSVYFKRRVLKLQGHFNQANEDVRQIVISAEKVEKRGARIAEVEFDDDGAEIIPAQMTRKLEAGE